MNNSSGKSKPLRRNSNMYSKGKMFNVFSRIWKCIRPHNTNSIYNRWKSTLEGMWQRLWNNSSSKGKSLRRNSNMHSKANVYNMLSGIWKCIRPYNTNSIYNRWKPTLESMWQRLWNNSSGKSKSLRRKCNMYSKSKMFNVFSRIWKCIRSYNSRHIYDRWKPALESMW